MDYGQVVESANSINIVEVAEKIVPSFTYHNTKPTMECCRHVDNKRGNFSFNLDMNIARCFTCSTTWKVIPFVQEYMFQNSSNSFVESLRYLYEVFPEYFQEEPFPKTGGKTFVKKEVWEGLSSKEYIFIGMYNKITINGESLNMREFYEKYPTEHDVLLLNSIKNMRDVIERIYKVSLSEGINNKKLKQDRKETCEYLFKLLKKGIKNKGILNHKSFKIEFLLKKLTS